MTSSSASPRLALCALFALVLGLAAFSAAPAAAAGGACFTYTCTGQSCTFNGGCTTATPFWRMWYDFGDGATSGYVGAGNVNHTYATVANGGPYNPLVTLTVIPWNGPIVSVSCYMGVNPAPFGPPLQLSGTCQ